MFYAKYGDVFGSIYKFYEAFDGGCILWPRVKTGTHNTTGQKEEKKTNERNGTKRNERVQSIK